MTDPIFLEDPWPIVERITLTAEERARCSMCNKRRLCIARADLQLCRVCRVLVPTGYTLYLMRRWLDYE